MRNEKLGVRPSSNQFLDRSRYQQVMKVTINVTENKFLVKLSYEYSSSKAKPREARKGECEKNTLNHYKFTDNDGNVSK